MVDWSFAEGFSFKISSKVNKVLVASSFAPTPKGATFASSSDAGRNCLYALSTHQDFEASLDVVTSILNIFSRDVHYVHYLLDPGSTLFPVNPFMAI